MTLIDDCAVIRILLDGRISSLCSRDDLLGKFATQIRWNKNIVRPLLAVSRRRQPRPPTCWTMPSSGCCRLLPVARRIGCQAEEPQLRSNAARHRDPRRRVEGGVFTNAYRRTPKFKQRNFEMIIRVLPTRWVLALIRLV